MSALKDNGLAKEIEPTGHYYATPSSEEEERNQEKAFSVIVPALGYNTLRAFIDCGTLRDVSVTEISVRWAYIGKSSILGNLSTALEI